MQPIQHIVLYSFSNSADLDAAMNHILALKTIALKNGQPYIVDIKCGTTVPSPPVRSRGILSDLALENGVLTPSQASILQH